MRQLRKLRDETAGEELSHDQQAEYAVDEFKRMIDQSKAVRLAKEELGIGKDSQSPETNGTNKANEDNTSDRSKPAKEKQKEDEIGSSCSAGFRPMPNSRSDGSGHGLQTHATEKPGRPAIIADSGGI